MIDTPIGGSYSNLMPVEKDEHIKFIETISGKNDGFISLFIAWNKKYSEIPIDEKYPYKGSHCQVKLSLEEATRLRDSLSRQIERMQNES